MAQASASSGRRITARGAATRERIVATANRIMRARGVAATTMDEVRAAAGVSTSQLYHYFADKPALIEAIAQARAAHLLTIQEQQLGALKSIRGLERWRDAHVQSSAATDAAFGCELGAISSELAVQDEAARQVLAGGFERWRALLATGLQRMIDNGTLRPDADPETLAIGLLAALQGGYVLAQSARDPGLIKTSVNVAIDRVRDFQVTPGP